MTAMVVLVGYLGETKMDKGQSAFGSYAAVRAPQIPSMLWLHKFEQPKELHVPFSPALQNFSRKKKTLHYRRRRQGPTDRKESAAAGNLIPRKQPPKTRERGERAKEIGNGSCSDSSRARSCSKYGMCGCQEAAAFCNASRHRIQSDQR
ncbi:uncharacterized protein LOC124657432 [Lolium rigidum]|uniref:uncharacterized protein LOC124657432 n=1 Tax=Lolium rigidum TaxID=89674 RepID=UPI001F5C5AC8|nr:uncharacterized protein LOC124657432 [Lolium rigidum]